MYGLTENDLRDILQAKYLLSRILREHENHQSRIISEEAAAREALHAARIDDEPFEERN